MSDLIESINQDTLLVEDQITSTIEVVDEEVITVAEEVITLISEAAQGPMGIQGIQGIQGLPGGTQLTASASIALSGHRAVLIDATGAASYASCDQVGHASRVVGMTTGAVVQGDIASVQIYGQVTEPSWNWSANLPIYLGVDGVPTQVPPVQPTSKFSLVIGFPITATSVFINIQSPIIIL